METGGKIKVKKFTGHEEMDLDNMDANQEFQTSS